MTLRDSIKPENLSIGSKIQSLAINCNNSKSHPILGFIGGRAIGVLLKPPVRIVDVALHAIIGVGKILVGIGFTAPVQLVAKIIGKNYTSDWNVKQGFFHLGYGTIYALDIVASPLINFISPNLYGRNVSKVSPKPVTPPSVAKPVSPIAPKPDSVELENLRKKLSDTETELNKVQAQLLKLPQLEQDKNQLNLQIQQLNTSIAALQQQIAAKENQLNAFDQQNKALVLQHNLTDIQSNNQIHGLNGTIAALNQQILVKTNQLNAFQNILNANQAELAAATNDKNAKETLLNQQGINHAAAIHQLNQDINALKKTIASKEVDLEAQINGNKLRSEAWQQRHDLQVKEEAQLRGILKNVRDDLHAALVDRDANLEKIKLLEGDVRNYEDALKEEQTKHNQLKAEKAALDIQLGTLQGDIAAIQNTLTQKLAELAAANDDSKAKDLLLQQQGVNHASAVLNLQRDIDTLKQTLVTKEADLETQKNENKKLSDDLKQKHNEYILEKARLEGNLKDVRDDLQTAKTQREAGLQKIQQVEAELKKQLDALNVEKTKHDQLKAEKAAQDTQLGTLQVEIVSLRGQLAVKDTDIQKVLKERDASLQNNADLQDQVAKIHAINLTFQAESNHQATEIKSLNQNNNKLGEMFVRKDDALIESNKSNVVLENRVKLLEAALVAEQAKITQLRQELMLKDPSRPLTPPAAPPLSNLPNSPNLLSSYIGLNENMVKDKLKDPLSLEDFILKAQDFFNNNLKDAPASVADGVENELLIEMKKVIGQFPVDSCPIILPKDYTDKQITSLLREICETEHNFYISILDFDSFYKTFAELFGEEADKYKDIPAFKTISKVHLQTLSDKWKEMIVESKKSFNAIVLMGHDDDTSQTLPAKIETLLLVSRPEHILGYMSCLKFLTQHYLPCINMIEEFKKDSAPDTKLKQWLKVYDNNNKKYMDMSNRIIKPMQRGPKFDLFFKALVKEMGNLPGNDRLQAALKIRGDFIGLMNLWTNTVTKL